MRNDFSNGAVAIVVFLIALIMGLQLALGGTLTGETFGWAVLFGVAFGLPALTVLAVAHVLQLWIGGWVTLILAIAAAVIYAFYSSLNSTAWNIALAILCATILHQLFYLKAALPKQSRPANRHPSDDDIFEQYAQHARQNSQANQVPD
jgi:hypothetical protein